MQTHTAGLQEHLAQPFMVRHTQLTVPMIHKLLIGATMPCSIDAGIPLLSLQLKATATATIKLALADSAVFVY